MGETPSDLQVQAWARLVWASQTVAGAIEAELKAAGFPALAWYDVLLELERAEGGELRPREIAEETLFTRYNVSRLIDRLQKNGLVERVPCPEDARGAVVRITDKGRKLRGEMWPAYAAAIRRHFADRLTEKEATQLAGTLSKLIR
jgi:DNA-binding MarR family transcriptional regulator